LSTPTTVAFMVSAANAALHESAMDVMRVLPLIRGFMMLGKSALKKNDGPPEWRRRQQPRSAA
ncbi:MAG: hypothetical protein WCX93_10515, partial [Burkholderiaceae bacterium]